MYFTNIMIKKIIASILAFCLVFNLSAQEQTLAPKASKKKPNILFIAVDDLKPLLNCYGATYMKTPNFDRLAKMGVSFTNAHVQQAVCGPSRASIMTGTYPDRTRVWDLHTDFRQSAPDLVSMPEHLANNGYETTAIGKIYHKGSTSPGHDGKSWTMPHTIPENYDPKYGEPAFSYYQDKNTKAQFDKMINVDGIKRNDAFKTLKPSTESADVPDEAYQDGIYTVEAVSKLKTLAKGNKPFFLGVGYQRPHLPFVAPKKYWDLYDRKNIPLAAFRALSANTPQLAYHSFGELMAFTDIDKNAKLGKELPEEKQRELIHGYMACISFIDAQLGKLLDAIEKNGLKDNTLIVLWGDHGFHLGDHTIWCKHSNFEQATRIPFMFAGPGVAKNIQVNAPVELVSTFPTLFDLAGVSHHPQEEGKSISALLDSDKKTTFSRTYAFGQYPRNKVMGYYVRTEKYRYTEWHGNNFRTNNDYDEANIVGIELYDYEKDPNESKNYAEDPAYATAAKMLKTLLVNELKTSRKNDPSKDKATPPKSQNGKGDEEGDEEGSGGKGKNKNGKNKGKKNDAQAEDGIKEEKTKDGKGKDGKGKGKNKTDKSQSNSTGKIEENAADKMVDVDPSDATPSQTKQPNVLFIISDDFGYHDLSINGSKLYQTPNIDKLAKSGVQFKQAYSSYPRCTPSRYGLITGTYPVNEHHGEVASIPANQNFIKQFKAAGYQSSYIGKWHLGEGNNAPKGFGFDHSFAAGAAGATSSQFYPFNGKKGGKQPEAEKDVEDVQEAGKDGDYLTDLLTDQTIKYIKNRDKSKPFFSMLAYYAVHTPIEGKPEDVKRNQEELKKINFGDTPEYIKEGNGRRKMRQDNPEYAAMVENVDQNIGRILASLQEQGLLENTIVVFTSDHGGLSNDGGNNRILATTNIPLKAGKGHLYEGGIRVPLIMQWTKGLKPMTEDNSVVLGMDVMTSLLDLSNGEKLSGGDGQSFVPVINKKENWNNRTVYWHEDKARPNSTGDSKCTVVRSGDYKLMHFYGDNKYEMYNVKKDISETTNIYDTEKSKAAELTKLLEAWKAKYLADFKPSKTIDPSDPKADKKAQRKEEKKAEKKAAKKAEKNGNKE
jgi:iduronate 2-sulfatase